MVRKRTEYRTSFQQGDARQLRRSWVGNADYCLTRRHSEHLHTPLHWDDELLECESTPRGVPSHIYRHERYNDIYDERKRKQLEERLARLQLGTGGIEIGPGLSVGRRESLSPLVGTPPSTRDADTPRHRHCSACVTKAQSDSEQVQTEGETAEEDVANNNTDATRRKTRYRKPLPKPRSMSAPLGRPAKKQRAESGPPFAPYGSKNKVRETSRKKTHNVRASSGVYLAALRAYRRREMEVKLRQEAAKAAPYMEKRRRALFNDKKPASWDTEYHGEYVGYDKGLYRHNINKRHNPHIAWQLYDVP